MDITFLGTSHGVPAADRFCSSVMLTVGDAVYLIDAGAPVSKELLRYGKQMQQLRAVFITHTHGDHTAGLLQLCDLMTWYYTDCSADFYVPEQAYVDALRGMIHAGGVPHMDDSRVRFRIPAEGLVYEDEYLRVAYIRTAHTAVSYAILITEVATGRRVLFGGDFSNNLQAHDIPSAIREDIDGFVCEMAHFGVSHLEPYLADCRAQRVLFTHVFPLAKYADIEGLKGKYPFDILTPTDGDTVHI